MVAGSITNNKYKYELPRITLQGEGGRDEKM
jgi:hypothetical protein